jgi:glycosyltransferase involved in cell wall biosynthesis
MQSISLCMIVKDEEDVLERCLESARDLVDELIIVDTGSLDATKDIARKYTENIFHFSWIGDFSAARNFSYSQATSDWVLFLDADEYLEEKDRQAFLELRGRLDKLRLEGITSISLFDARGTGSDGKPQLRFPRTRLVLREAGFVWRGFVHEYLDKPGSSSIVETIDIRHHKTRSVGDRNLRMFREKKKDAKYAFTARDWFYYGRELFYNRCYEEAIDVLQFHQGLTAWIEDKINGRLFLADAYTALKQYSSARREIYASFDLTPTPRAEHTYRLALAFQLEGKITHAIYWYESILRLPAPNEETASFQQAEYRTWRPYLQLSICYWKLGDKQRAIISHRAALAINPHDPFVKKNEEFFSSLTV